MAKSILKEIIIMLLLFLAVLLLMAVILYMYAPSKKIVPEIEEYVAPAEVAEILKDTSSDDAQVVLTYEVNEPDLENAERINSYSPGKLNPFSSYIPEETTDGTNTTSGNSGNTTSSSTSTSSSSSNTTSTNTTKSSTDNSTTSSEGRFTKDKGTK